MTVATVEPGPYSMHGAGPNYNAARDVRANTPWNQIVFPPFVWDPSSAMALPSVGRAVALIAGQIRQMPMDDYKGIEPQARPRLLEQPDPVQARSWFVGMEVEDYLLHGNALNYITAYDKTGWPAAAAWLPASWVDIQWDPTSTTYSTPAYWVAGRKLDASRVVHVKRGADDRYPVRGVGVVEQHISALARVSNADRYESDALAGSGVPSVAVITPNPRLSKSEADAAKADWLDKFAGPNREPAILPAGTQVIPLAWSPTDAQLTAVRGMNLQDVANMFNLDGYYLGAPGGSMTYRSPGPMFLQLLRITLEPIVSDIEGTWSQAWLPRGHTLRFDRKSLLQDDLGTTILTLRNAVQSGLMSLEEARMYLGLPVVASPGASITSPVATTETTPTPTDTQPAEEALP